MIPLIVRSHYSLMRGTASVRELCRTARRIGYERLALTDTDNLYGLWPFLTACRREGITPIVGAEITDPNGKGRAVCLVEDDGGYRNLCRLITRRHLAEAFSLKKDLPAYREGLTVLVQDAGLLSAWHAAGVRVAAAMPGRPLSAVNPLRQAAARLGLPLAATPESFFLRPEDLEIHKLLRAIDRNTSLSRMAPEDAAPADAWLAPPAEYDRRFAVSPGAVRATHAISERLAFTGPRFGPVFPPWADPEGREASSILREAAYAGARERYGPKLSGPVVDRLEHELSMIATMGFSAYFLIVRSIVRRSPRTCGRGSGAASLVAYVLGITNVCPIKHNLYFERFLNPGRTDPPDIDVDFAWDEREGVIGAVLEKYRGCAAMVSNHVLFQPRMAIRETGKVFGLTDAEIGRVSRRLPPFWRSEGEEDFLDELKAEPELRGKDFPPPWPEILRFARRIIGAPRHLSVHPGGVVITPGPIDAYAPIERAPKGVPILQWEKDGTEEAGLVKIDLLGNRSLGVIRDAVRNIRENGMSFPESGWEPEDDPATQAALAEGKTMGCFYIESPAMRLLQKKTRVGDFAHLVIHSSIIRPAANIFIREYIRRLHGGAWEPIHPLLSEVLEETFGIMVYQEDVSRAAVALAGFSHAEADRLRKILSKKDREYQLRDFYRRFAEGARIRGVSEDQIAGIWEMMMSFDGYSFCKPHSASYARVSFQAAYLKTHFPAELMAAVLSNQGGFYSTFAYVSEARRLGIGILPPDVNESLEAWTGKERKMRVGLLSVKGVSASTRERILAERRERPFGDPPDFLERVRPDAAEARALIHAGALDRLDVAGSRAGLLWALARWRRDGAEKTPAGSLFPPVRETPSSPVFPSEDARERLRREFAVLGFLCDRHPMTLFSESLARRGAIKASRLNELPGKRVRFAGWLITGKIVHTRHGDPMEFLTFEDETGVVETVFFPEAYRRFCHMFDRERPYLLSGRVEEDWGAVTLSVDRAEAL